MLIGYARVSKQLGQDPTVQVQAVRAAGVERVFVEHASGGRWDRPELPRLLDTLRPGDVLAVWKLDRPSPQPGRPADPAGPSALDVGFRSLTEQIDTTTPARQMMLQMRGALAEFERGMIRDVPVRAWLPPAPRAASADTNPSSAELVRGVQKGRYSLAQAARLLRSTQPR
ncbi:hypothetical protein GCM10022631_29190 [Deinococcus rubellus]|uniref:recombinase family protein n=1 Tax=Deinococcus rubellus TaxID=1889240 RepID=UPI0031EEC185